MQSLWATEGRGPGSENLTPEARSTDRREHEAARNHTDRLTSITSPEVGNDLDTSFASDEQNKCDCRLAFAKQLYLAKDASFLLAFRPPARSPSRRAR